MQVGGIKSEHGLLHFNRRKLAKLLHMSGEDLYKLIRETTGSRLYQERRAETVKILRKTDTENSRTVNLMAELERKIKTLRKGKEDWVKHDQQDQLVQSIRFLLYERKEGLYDDKVDELQKKIQGLTGELEDARDSLDELRKTREEAREKIKNQIATRKRLQEQESEWVQVLAKDLGRSRDLLSKEIRSTIQSRQNRDQQMQEHMERLEEVESEYQNTLKKKIAIEKYMKSSRSKKQGPKATQDSVETLNSTQNTVSQREQVKALDNRIKGLSKQVKSIAQQQRSKNKRIQANEQELQQKLEELKQTGGQMDRLKERKYECMLSENRLGARQQKINDEIISFRNSLEGFYGGVNILSLTRVVDQARVRGLSGVVGIVARLIQIKAEDLAPMFEVLFKHKMFSIVVEREADVLPLLDLNDELKGGKIKVIPLEWYNMDDVELSRQSRLHISDLNLSVNDPGEEELMPFNRCYDLREEFQEKAYTPKLNYCLYEIFKAGGIVKDITQAFAIAKKKRISCVTPDLQVIFSGGYLTKAGYQNKARMHLSTFNLFQAKMESLVEVGDEAQQVQSTKEQIRAEEDQLAKHVRSQQDKILRLKTEIEKLSKGGLTRERISAEQAGAAQQRHIRAERGAHIAGQGRGRQHGNDPSAHGCREPEAEHGHGQAGAPAQGARQVHQKNREPGLRGQDVEYEPVRDAQGEDEGLEGSRAAARK